MHSPRRRPPAGYTGWLTDLEARIHAAQQRAALAVNRELLQLYWQVGRDILDRQALEGWGAGIVDQVSADLRAKFPEMKGFLRSNLKYMRAFAEAWLDFAIGQQVVGQSTRAYGPTAASTTKAWEQAAAHLLDCPSVHEDGCCPQSP